MKYGLKQFRKDFPTERACLDFIFETLHTPECACGGSYALREGRRQYQCSKCRFHIAPTASTLFYKSDTPLTLWFGAILAFSNAKSGISAKELERQLEVTYKTAHRMKRLGKMICEKDFSSVSAFSSPMAFSSSNGASTRYHYERWSRLRPSSPCSDTNRASNKRRTGSPL